MAHWPAYRFWLVLACLLAPVSAGAEDAPRGPPGAALHWVRLPGAEDCSGGDALSRAVEAKLGHQVFPEPRRASVLIEGHVERAAGGYRAQLQMRSSDGALLGSRDLSSQASDCGELSETIAVVLAVMIDPDAAQGDAPAPPAKEEPPPSPGKYAQRIVGFARLLFNLNPTEPTAGVGAAYEIALGGWGGLRAEIALFAPNEVQRSAGGLLVYSVGYAGLGYCPLWLNTGRLRSAACGSAEFGTLYAWGTEFPGAERAEPKPWVSASLSARLAVRLVGMLEAHLGGGVAFPLKRYEYGSSGDPTLTVDEPLGMLDIGFGARF